MVRSNPSIERMSQGPLCAPWLTLEVKRQVPRMKRVAIARVAMCWSTLGNVKAILWTVELAHSQETQLCGFSELAFAGFHREIAKEAVSGNVLSAI